MLLAAERTRSSPAAPAPTDASGIDHATNAVAGPLPVAGAVAGPLPGAGAVAGCRARGWGRGCGKRRPPLPPVGYPPVRGPQEPAGGVPAWAQARGSGGLRSAQLGTGVGWAGRR